MSKLTYDRLCIDHTLLEHVLKSGIIPKDTCFTVSFPHVETLAPKFNPKIGFYVALMDFPVDRMLSELVINATDALGVKVARQNFFKEMEGRGYIKRLMFNIDVLFNTSTPLNQEEAREAVYIPGHN